MASGSESASTSVKNPHVKPYRASDLDTYGRRLAICTLDNDIKVYGTSIGGTSPTTLFAELKGHEGAVWQVSWSHSTFGNLLASCGSDGKVIIWKEENLSFVKLHEFVHHADSVNSVRFAPKEYGLVLACGSSDSFISFLTYNDETRNWDGQRIENAHRDGCNCLSWAPMTSDPTKFVKRLVSGGNDSLVKIWTEVEGMWVEQNNLEGHSADVTHVAWNPCAWVYSHTIASCSKDRKVIMWTSDDGTNWIPTVLQTCLHEPQNVTFSATQNSLTVPEENSMISVWNQDAAGTWSKSKVIFAPHPDMTEIIADLNRTSS